MQASCPAAGGPKPMYAKVIACCTAVAVYTLVHLPVRIGTFRSGGLGAFYGWAGQGSFGRLVLLADILSARRASPAPRIPALRGLRARHPKLPWPAQP